MAKWKMCYNITNNQQILFLIDITSDVSHLNTMQEMCRNMSLCVTWKFTKKPPKRQGPIKLSCIINHLGCMLLYPGAASQCGKICLYIWP